MAQYQEHLDGEAFGQIVSRFLASGLAVAAELLGDAALAEDAVQETFLRVVRGRERYIPSMPFSTWFYAILRNVCKDLLRRSARQAKLIEEVAYVRDTEVAGPPANSAEADELLAKLSRDARTVLRLRIVYDLSFREAAAALGISEEAAKKRAQRALRELRKRTADSDAHDVGAGREGCRNALPREIVPSSVSQTY